MHIIGCEITQIKPILAKNEKCERVSFDIHSASLPPTPGMAALPLLSHYRSDEQVTKIIKIFMFFILYVTLFQCTY